MPAHPDDGAHPHIVRANAQLTGHVIAIYRDDRGRPGLHGKLLLQGFSWGVSSARRALRSASGAASPGAPCEIASASRCSRRRPSAISLPQHRPGNGFRQANEHLRGGSGLLGQPVSESALMLAILRLMLAILPISSSRLSTSSDFAPP